MVAFVGLNSVLDRTLFTNKGPIVKRPLELLTGSNLRVLSSNTVYIETGSFTETDVGRLISITGSPAGRNDGSFRISEVLSTQSLRLADTSFSILDVAATTASVVALANDLKVQYAAHRTRKVTVDGVQEGVHGSDDFVNMVTASSAIDLATSITLLNDIRNKFALHIVDVTLDPSVHVEEDDANGPSANLADSLTSCILLANDLRRKFEAHRQDRFVHSHSDIVDKVTVSAVVATTGTYPGPLTGPFSWTLKDPRTGSVADDPYDVDVYVNGIQVPVDAVFGSVGAVVLATKPAGSDVVTIDYDFLGNPPAKFMKLNSPGFVLNQAGNRGISGLPGHKYRSRSHLISPGQGPSELFSSAKQPLRRGWKYKALERAYTAVLNDPTTLLLNVPSNKISYPVLFDKVSEVTVRYDPVTLPQNSLDPWTLEGEGTFSLAPGGGMLTIVDSSVQTGTDSLPPFFSHPLDVKAASILSAAFRVRLSDDPSFFFPDGVFSGVAFGISDGQRSVVAGLLLTEATGLSSAVVMANQLKVQFNSHLLNFGSHSPDDTDSLVGVVNATDLTSLVILLNEILEKYSIHIAKGSGVGLVHAVADAANVVSSLPADDLDTAVVLVNELRGKFNSHGSQAGVHYVSDLTHIVDEVRQVGLLTNRGYPEFSSSWNCAAVDWRSFRTFRIFRESGGEAELFLSGDTEASASVPLLELPSLSDLDGKFDQLQQAFFGSIGKDSKSSSDWQFVRVNFQPVDSNLIEDNKQVVYNGSVLPELDTPPWITYGQGGVERVVSGGFLLLDSTSSAFAEDVSSLGLASGAYRGFARLEPILTSAAASAVEFRASADYWTQSLDNRAMSVVLDDDSVSVQIAFLQYSPSPAVATGTVTEPFVLVTGDDIVLQFGGETPVQVVFSVPPDVNDAAGVAARMNADLGFSFASDEGGKIKFTSQDLGASASFSVLSGRALGKLGFSPGTYFGGDSNPEPKVSWFGANLPDLDNPVWSKTGDQEVTLLGRTLRVTDSSVSDYAVYSVSAFIVTNQAISPSTDWKLDFRVSMISFAAGDAVPASGPYQSLLFCGALVSVDEGPGGKSVEVHLSSDSSGNPYVNLLSFNPSTGALDVVSQYAFNWKDGVQHSYNVFTSKGSNAILVLVDGSVLSPSAGPSPTYSSLNAGLSGPNVTFGSGGESVTGSDLRLARSVVDWHSVAVFKDSKLADPDAADRRFIGLYRGGSPDLLSSYYLHQVDWSSMHVYRVVRDPTVGVSVYVDGGPVPVIAASYDSLTLPPSSAGFLKEASGSNPVIAFGSFSPSELCRSRWDYVRYSIGKITLTERLIPPHQVLNQGNVVASPDHLNTNKPHNHQGFRVYSGGTPLDEFMADSEVVSHTVLGADTPPVPMTQNLESRHGLRRVGTPLDGIDVVNLVNTKGFITDLEDDTVNVVDQEAETVAAATTSLVAASNELKTVYNLHRVALGVHAVNDVVNVVAAATATDLASSILLLNDVKEKFNLHREETGSHVPDDGSNEIVADDAIDVSSAVTLCVELLQKFSSHAVTGNFHVTDDSVNVVSTADATDLATSALLAAVLAESLTAHALSTTFHLVADRNNGVLARGLPGVGSSMVESFNTLVTESALSPGQLVKFLDGPNAGVQVVVVASGAATQYQIAPLLVNDSSGSFFVRMGSAFVAPASMVTGVQILVDSPGVSVSVGDSITFLDGPNVGIIRTVSSVVSSTDFSVGSAFPVLDGTSRTMSRVSSPLTPGVEPTAIVSFTNLLRDRISGHFVAFGIHPTADDLDVVSEPAAIVLADTIPLLNELKDALNLHLAGSKYHSESDLVNVPSSDPPTDPLQSSIDVLNILRSAYASHLGLRRVHLTEDDKNVVALGDATDLDEAMALANSLKEEFNLHRTATVNETNKVHSEDDSANVVSAADATDLATLATLVNDLVAKFDAHREQVGVHGSSLFIRIDVPDRVLYEGMKFWTFDEGDPTALLSPFSDDETLHIDGAIAYTGPKGFSYSGNVLPEDDAEEKVRLLANDLKSVFNAHRTESGVHPADDSVNVVSAADAMDLVSSLVLLAELADKVAAHTVELGVHVADDPHNAPLCPAPTNVKMAISSATELYLKLEAHRVNTGSHLVVDTVNRVTAELPPSVQSLGWVRRDSGSGDVSTSLIVEGPISALRYGVDSPGAASAYSMSTGLPDAPSVTLEVTVRMRVHSFNYDPDVDTGIYVGFLSSTGPGISAAIGFDAINDIPYVKIQDVNANVPVFRTPFDWDDGAFHRYKLSKDAETGTVNLTVLE